MRCRLLLAVLLCCSPWPAAAAACAPFARRRVHGPRPEQPHLARDLLAGAAEEQ